MSFSRKGGSISQGDLEYPSEWEGHGLPAVPEECIADGIRWADARALPDSLTNAAWQSPTTGSLLRYLVRDDAQD